MERKKSFWSYLGIIIVKITAVFVAILVILAVSINIAGDWKLIAWVLGTTFFISFIAWKVGCFQKNN